MTLKNLSAAAISAALVLLCQQGTAQPDQVHASEILERAFENRYGIGIASTIDLELRSKTGSIASRTIQTVSTTIGGRMHSIGRLVKPEHLRGMTVLSIEAENRNHDAFLYLPSTQIVRRISTAQRGDSFFGTDVTYEDIEQQRASDYEFTSSAEITWNDEPAYSIDAVPTKSFNFARVKFVVAKSDFVVLVSEYYKANAAQPYRTVEVERDAVETAEGHAIPTLFSVRNRTSGSTTTVRLRNLQVNPEIDHRIFSIKTLSSQKRLPLVAK